MQLIPQSIIPKWLIFVFILSPVIGMADTAYLTFKHYFGIPIVCFITKNCDLVLTSKYSEIFGVPVSLSGFFYYLIFFFLSLAVFLKKTEKFYIFFPIISLGGFLASLWFTYLQFFVIRAFCQYCLLSAFISTSLFILNVFMLKYKKNSV